MRSLTRLWVGGLAAALLLAAACSPTQAAESLITATKAADLMLPLAQIPTDMRFRADQSGPIVAKGLAPLIGTSMLRVFQQNGWLLGYHGWLDAKASASAPFATYDIYTFANTKGAQLTRLTYQSEIPGIQYTAQVSSTLPKSATVWTDTGQFGASGYYAEAEVLFRVANVVGDVTGFSVAASGQDGQAITTALAQATEATAACVHWLSGRLQAPAHAGMPLLPLAGLPLALPRLRRR